MQHSAWHRSICLEAAKNRYELFRLRHNSFEADIHLL